MNVELASSRRKAMRISCRRNSRQWVGEIRPVHSRRFVGVQITEDVACTSGGANLRQADSENQSKSHDTRHRPSVIRRCILTVIARGPVEGCAAVNEEPAAGRCESVAVSGSRGLPG